MDGIVNDVIVVDGITTGKLFNGNASVTVCDGVVRYDIVIAGGMEVDTKVAVRGYSIASDVIATRVTEANAIEGVRDGIINDVVVVGGVEVDAIFIVRNIIVGDNVAIGGSEDEDATINVRGYGVVSDCVTVTGGGEDDTPIAQGTTIVFNITILSSHQSHT